MVTKTGSLENRPAPWTSDPFWNAPSLVNKRGWPWEDQSLVFSIYHIILYHQSLVLYILSCVIYVYIYILSVPVACLPYLLYPTLQCSGGLVYITGEVRQLSGQQDVPGVREMNATKRTHTVGRIPNHNIVGISNWM